MRTETDLRDLLRSVDSSGVDSPDLRTVIARSKRRRLPRQLGMGGAVALAVGGISVVGIQNVASFTAAPHIAAEDSSVDSPDSAGRESGPNMAMERAPLEKLNLCGGPLAEVGAGTTGLVVTAGFPDAAAGATELAGTVTLRNTGPQTMSATMNTAPVVTITRDGVVVWHSTGLSNEMTRLELAPGGSIGVASSLTPAECARDDELADGLRSGLPPLPAGRYGVSAAVEITPDTTGIPEIATGPETVIELR